MAGQFSDLELLADPGTGLSLITAPPALVGGGADCRPVSPSTVPDTAMATAHARRSAAGAVAAADEAVASVWTIGRALGGDGMTGRARIVGARAAGIEIDLGLGGADTGEGQGEGDDELFHGIPVGGWGSVGGLSA